MTIDFLRIGQRFKSFLQFNQIIIISEHFSSPFDSQQDIKLQL
jgi:hypothetical protein